MDILETDGRIDLDDLTCEPETEGRIREAGMAACLEHLLDGLTPRERRIIELRFGLHNGGIALTYVVIGEMLGIPSSRVQSLSQQALRRMRKPRISGTTAALEYLEDAGFPDCTPSAQTRALRRRLEQEAQERLEREAAEARRRQERWEAETAERLKRDELYRVSDEVAEYLEQFSVSGYTAPQVHPGHEYRPPVVVPRPELPDGWVWTQTCADIVELRDSRTLLRGYLARLKDRGGSIVWLPVALRGFNFFAHEGRTRTSLLNAMELLEGIAHTATKFPPRPSVP